MLSLSKACRGLLVATGQTLVHAILLVVLWTSALYLLHLLLTFFEIGQEWEPLPTFLQFCTSWTVFIIFCLVSVPRLVDPRDPRTHTSSQTDCSNHV